MQSLESESTRRAVTLTDAAIAKVHELVRAEDDPSLLLRIGVRPGGCSGSSYELYFDTQVSPGDIVENFREGVRVVIDPESLEHVRGSTLDYGSDPMYTGFAIDNPNVAGACGCSSSTD
ncbi:MAG: iron-sulfur cluster assembly accessory protein [Actinobacteria bacterium]|nr:iron-sulfur cluster assembly accessory protein [Actinomycetota bacterium]